MEKDKTHILAEKIALLLQENRSGDDFLRANFEKINQRLDRLESNAEPQDAPPVFSTVVSPRPTHFSQEKFHNLEEFADEIISNFQTEKACPFEPAGKPCDNCAMCNSRGF